LTNRWGPPQASSTQSISLIHAGPHRRAPVSQHFYTAFFSVLSSAFFKRGDFRAVSGDKSAHKSSLHKIRLIESARWVQRRAVPTATAPIAPAIPTAPATPTTAPVPPAPSIPSTTAILTATMGRGSLNRGGGGGPASPPKSSHQPFGLPGPGPCKASRLFLAVGNWPLSRVFKKDFGPAPSPL